MSAESSVSESSPVRSMVDWWAVRFVWTGAGESRSFLAAEVRLREEVVTVLFGVSVLMISTVPSDVSESAAGSGGRFLRRSSSVSHAIMLLLEHRAHGVRA